MPGGLSESPGRAASSSHLAMSAGEACVAAEIAASTATVAIAVGKFRLTIATSWIHRRASPLEPRLLVQTLSLGGSVRFNDEVSPKFPRSDRRGSHRRRDGP